MGFNVGLKDPGNFVAIGNIELQDPGTAPQRFNFLLNLFGKAGFAAAVENNIVAIPGQAQRVRFPGSTRSPKLLLTCSSSSVIFAGVVRLKDIQTATGGKRYPIRLSAC